VAKLKATNGMAGDEFGSSVALSANLAVVGAPYKNSAAGSAYVYKGAHSMWTEDAELVSADAAVSEWFGGDVAASEGKIIVGCGGDDTGGTDAGAAYVFAEPGADWEREATLTAGVDAGVYQFFGCSVDIDAESRTAVVGAYGTDGERGAAYVFRSASSDNPLDAWDREWVLLAPDAAVMDRFGWSVAISGDLAVVGACQDDDKGADSGSVYVFARSLATTWNQLQKLTASDGAANDFFGRSVDVRSGTALLGAPETTRPGEPPTSSAA